MQLHHSCMHFVDLFFTPICSNLESMHDTSSRTHLKGIRSPLHQLVAQPQFHSGVPVFVPNFFPDCRLLSSGLAQHVSTPTSVPGYIAPYQSVTDPSLAVQRTAQFDLVWLHPAEKQPSLWTF